MKKAKKVTTDGLEIIDQELYLGKPDRRAQLEHAKADDALVRKIYDLRSKAGLNQKQPRSLWEPRIR
jgi:hypothetical protein